jgi:hypothetical protein
VRTIYVRQAKSRAAVGSFENVPFKYFDSETNIIPIRVHKLLHVPFAKVAILLCSLC